VETKDKRALRVGLANGQITPDGKADDDGPCTGVQSPDLDETLHNRFGGGTWNKNGIANPTIEGIGVEMVLVDKKTNAAIALGHRAPGTRVPMAARYDLSAVDEGERRVTPRWLSAVPATNPLAVKEGDPETAATASGRLFVPYGMQDSAKGWRLAAMDVDTGRNLWDVAVPRTTRGTPPDGVVASERHVFVPHWTYLDVFDARTGAHQYTVGVW
jgi:outer membrane protein assembly factor BamB